MTGDLGRGWAPDPEAASTCASGYELALCCSTVCQAGPPQTLSLQGRSAQSQELALLGAMGVRLSLGDVGRSRGEEEFFAAAAAPRGEGPVCTRGHISGSCSQRGWSAALPGA